MPIVHTAHLRVREDCVERFRDRLLRHADATLNAEPGCSQFDVHQETSDRTLFLLIETYADQASVAAHREASHYLQFREDVAEWVVDRTWWYWTRLKSNTP